MSKNIKTLLVLLFMALCSITAVSAKARKIPTILLDPGHNPEARGALGIRGIYEIDYNDNLVAKLAKLLRAANFKVELTRTPQQSASLQERAELANRTQPILFLAIHHDSAQPIYLQKINRKLGVAYQDIKPIHGYSIFVSKKNSNFANSYSFAKALGSEMLKTGRAPSLHHAEKISGEGRELLDKKLGIYRFDNLIVLKKTQVPAVLLEVGVIVDQQDEAYISDANNQTIICQAIVKSIQHWAKNVNYK